MRNWCVKVENGNISKANRKFWKDCLPFLFLTFCAYGILLSRHYAVDTYVCCRNEQVTIFLQNGRWLGASIFAILNYFGIYGGAIQQLLTFVHIGLLTLSALILYRTLCPVEIEYGIKQFGFYGTILITFCNVFYQEILLYPENGLVMGLGILLCILAIRVSAKEPFTKRNFFAALILLCMSLGTYQAFIGIYIPWALAAAFSKRYEHRQLYIYAAKILSVGAIASISNILILQAILKTSISETATRKPLLTIEHFLMRSKELFAAQKSIWFDSYGFLPAGLVIAVTVVAIVLFLRGTHKKENMAYLFICIIGTLGVIFAPLLLINDLWLPQRTLIGCFSLLAVILFAAMMCNEHAKKVISAVILVFFCINIVQMQRIAANHIATNRLDQSYALMIQSAIEKYESSSGYTVKYIAAENDIYPTWLYPGIEYVIYDTNTRAFVVNWADDELLNYYTGRDYTEVPMDDEIFDMNFKDKNWDEFNSSEQLIFDEETMYWIKY